MLIIHLIGAAAAGMLLGWATGAARICRLARNVAGLNALLHAARYLNDHDQLTGLYNRTAAERHFLRAVKNNAPVTLALVDLDGFKQVNDTYGYQAGDDLIRAAAERLARCAEHHGGVAARFGGDEFVLLLPGEVGAWQAVLDLQAPAVLRTDDGDITIPAAGSAGIAVRDGDLGYADLLHRADIALHHAKQERGSYRRYRTEMRMPRTAGRHGPRLRDRTEHGQAPA
ncbi:GGDEF domain-containing protein [Actinoplanes sp. DH11]|uniref:GGDEF domain-containing protein n=1 Tax=Actinoplanes sp. DH11 TaxID=2857011 RepID=UPI001E3DA526|nr:GGDEF domain-containing protein [Actinoplanes sp. DH11]